MRIVIDIPEDIRIAIGQMGLLRIPDEMIRVVDKAIQHSIPLDHALNTITDGIKEEADYAYADFNKYKEDVLGAELDELPDDDFRYGLNRAIEIINMFEGGGEGINGKYRGDDKEDS